MARGCGAAAGAPGSSGCGRCISLRPQPSAANVQAAQFARPAGAWLLIARGRASGLWYLKAFGCEGRFLAGASPVPPRALSGALHTTRQLHAAPVQTRSSHSLSHARLHPNVLQCRDMPHVMQALQLAEQGSPPAAAAAPRWRHSPPLLNDPAAALASDDHGSACA
jgi:hypothetical protein